MLASVDSAEKRETANDGEGLEARRFDAALTVARQYLSPDHEAAPATTIVIRAEAAPPAGATNAPEPDPVAPIRAHGLPITRAAYERLRCDAAVAVERALDDGTVERSPTKDAIPRRVRRAVRARDLGCCRWPGCNQRATVQLHHIVWRSRYGSNDVGNLVSLCHYHHRSVHHRGWRVDGDANGKLLFTDRSGRIANERTDRRRALPHGALMRAQADRGFTPDPSTIATALGDRLDREWAVGTICHNNEIYARRN
jgi:hypothetical protein